MMEFSLNTSRFTVCAVVELSKVLGRLQMHQRQRANDARLDYLLVLLQRQNHTAPLFGSPIDFRLPYFGAVLGLKVSAGSVVPAFSNFRRPAS